MTEASSLRLVALDSEDLQIISVHTQDALMRVADMVFLPKSQRFAMILNRFNWQNADSTARRSPKTFERRRSALNFDRVLDVKVQNINIRDADAILELLAIQFDESDAPAGQVTMIFAGGGAIRIAVECIEAQMEDLGAAWQTTNLPQHALDETGQDVSDEAGS